MYSRKKLSEYKRSIASKTIQMRHPVHETTFHRLRSERVDVFKYSHTSIFESASKKKSDISGEWKKVDLITMRMEAVPNRSVSTRSWKQSWVIPSRRKFN